MKNVFVVVGLVAACTVCGDLCDAEEIKKENAVAKQAVVLAAKEPELKHIDLGAADQPDSSAPGPMELWETYDQNTGLPDVSESDAPFELE